MQLVKTKDLFGNLRIIMKITNGNEAIMDNFILRENPECADSQVALNNIFYNKNFVDLSTYVSTVSDVVITGDANFTPHVYTIGVMGGCICRGAKISFIDDPLGTYCDYVKSSKVLPVGAFKIDTSKKMLDLWAKRGTVCTYLSLENKNLTVSRLCGSTRTKLYNFNTTVSAMHFAAKFLKCQSITLHKCSYLSKECKEGYLQYKNGFLHPSDEINVLSVEAAIEMCKEAGVDIYIVEE